MAEALSPNTKQRPLFSPVKSHLLIGSNDDKLERAEARAARAAAIRRKVTASAATPAPSAADSCLEKEQILELFHNCIKLASENKINQKNTWELNFIDHLCEIVKVEDENDVETNFQKASCTLEAGVKIYSMRVDSVHSEAYKVLAGINRVGMEDEQDCVTKDANLNSEQGAMDEKKKQGKKTNLIKESIRMGYNNFGDFYYSHGLLGEAILVSIEMGQFANVSECNFGSIQGSLDLMQVVWLNCLSPL